MNKPTPEEALAAACQVETIERNGFKAVILRLRGNGYFSECLEELHHLVKSHTPTIQPDGTVSHFLVFDLKDVGLITDSLPGVFLQGLRGGVATPTGIVPAVCLIHLNEHAKSNMRFLRLENLLPWFADEQTAFDAMTPAGISSTISSWEAVLRGKGNPST